MVGYCILAVIAAFLAVIFIRTALFRPRQQAAADPALAPGAAPEGCRDFEYEGCDWDNLARVLREL